MEFLMSTRRAESRAVAEFAAGADDDDDDDDDVEVVMMLSSSWVMRDMTASANASVLS